MAQCSLILVPTDPFLQSDTKKAEAEMKLYYVCTNPNCHHRWTE